MRSNNPVFNNNPAFNGQAGYGQAAYPPPPPGYAPQGGYQAQGAYQAQQPYGAPQQAPQATRPMTIDDVVQKTGLSLVVVIFAAAATWILTPPIDENIAPLSMAMMVGMFAGLGIGLYAAFTRKMLNPAVVLAYAAAQGVFMGAFSKFMETQYEGIVVNAVLGTVAAAGGVLAAYKFLGIKVGDGFRKGFFAAALGFGALLLVGFGLQAFGFDTGLFGNGPLGLLIAIAGLGFGIVGLIMDFDMVENGLRAGVPEKFAWTAAFGLTASLVMVYFYLLRILAILQSDD